MKNILCVLIITNCSLLFAQPTFQRTIGGTSYDWANSISPTTDGGYVIAGSTSSFGVAANSLYIVKIDYSGLIEWAKTIGISGVPNGTGSIIQTSDGGYAIAGYIRRTGQLVDMCIVKLNASGMFQWSKAINVNSDDEYATSIIQTTDGGYIAVGWGFIMYISKFNASGTLQWMKSVGPGFSIATSIISTADGGFAIGGQINSFGAGSFDMFIVKFDSSGTFQWSKTIGGANYDRVNSIIQTSDGGYAAAGITNSFGAGNYDMYIVKLDASGTLQWTKTIGGANYDFAYSIVQTAEGGYVVAGQANNNTQGNAGDMYIVKLNASGTLQWTKTIGGAGTDDGSSIIRTTDNGCIVAGTTQSLGAGNDMFIVKLDSAGNSCGNLITYPSQSGNGGTVTSPTPTVNILTPTVTTPSSTTSSGGTATTLCLVGVHSISNEMPNSYKLLQNYPNPFNPKTNITYQISKMNTVTLSVFDVLGHEISVLVNREQGAGNYEITWDATNFPSGVYFFKIIAGDFVDTKKMLLVK